MVEEKVEAVETVEAVMVVEKGAVEKGAGMEGAWAGA